MGVASLPEQKPMGTTGFSMVAVLIMGVATWIVWHLTSGENND